MTVTASTDFVGDIVTKWRGALATDGAGDGKAISQRELARKLSERISPHGSISYGAVHNWEVGLAVPPYWFLLAVYLTTPGWPRNMALEMLARVRPDLWGHAIQGQRFGDFYTELVANADLRNGDWVLRSQPVLVDAPADEIGAADA